MIIDAHAHILTSYPQILNGVHTYALHPWDIDPNIDLNSFKLEFKKEVLKRAHSLKAIGECGLDRARLESVDIQLQKQVFLIHLEIAQEFSLPMIIHCVRSFSDMLEILKSISPKIPLMFHAFNGNQVEMDSLLKYNAYFSQGLSLFKNYSKIHQIPLERLLLESGDQNEKTIEEIYLKAALDLNLKKEALSQRVVENTLKFFNADNISPADFVKNLQISKS